MSRDLPLHPNIEHLRKQAKERLRELQQRDPHAKLVDAQHEIAREYGFASWPKLRAHVESRESQADPTAATVAPPSRGGDGGRASIDADELPPARFQFERYTPKAKQALFFSRHEAGQFGSIAIEPEHILLGLVRASQDLRSRLFERAGLSLVDARAKVSPTTPVREPLPSSVEIPFSDSTRQLLRAATDEADTLMHHDVGIAHVLLGLLREQRSMATSILREKGMNSEAVRQDIVGLLSEEAM